MREVNYANIVIYKIVCSNNDVKDCYVGQTSDFIRRKRAHKTICNNSSSSSYDLQVYKTIRENGGWKNWIMTEIEKYPCENERDATKRERFWIEELKSNLNSIIPNRSDIEKKSNKNKYSKDYYDLNKEELIFYQKKYRESNNDKIVERSKTYYDTKKNEILQKQGEKHICECGKEYTQNHFKRHLNTKFHKEFKAI
jgi:hypothetical protein